MTLWDLESKVCIAHLEFGKRLQVQVQISFSTNGTSVSVLKNSDGARSWHISPNHSIDLTRNSIMNSDGTKSWLTSRPSKSFVAQLDILFNHPRDPITNHTKLPMVFVLTIEEQSNQDTSMLFQCCCCDSNGEWILDQDGRRIVWIPPDERPRNIWGGFKREKKVLVQTESGKVYFANFLQS
jgi:hypothetical protein